ncbi:hypothetical protein A3F03_02490 [Candidatus Roizmanbacteria bacterium RIFCSPHIGHO2_12_FULL_41_11]|uniref:Ribonuclease VapC n=3 Tax=Candidatus Roizmaniibacteriota TaxID=1752723 RepID=A0A1F7JR85_9BACT|nr:MAG: hypothetical protein A3F03_02490 [Candidatus Roizmanbacteria bacterium RIFCSPHIGHO2_12_FULL_41_11]OGK51195.1 MAG: hypothetical protein A2966_00970 [Candidatus Roizmanbacteria bacterium RIFCSPLOWO2_01_FULL_41_22]OGK58125.1 MAG: hypothetical protein A3H86_03875 [Candidatus Roizmanbacteria bacterium RIFCSPLOWO2_02_FULL_41_9]
MKTYLIDTDVFIDFFKKRNQAVQLIEHLSTLGDFFVSVITVAELRSGWTGKEGVIYLPKLYDIAQVIPVTKEIAESAGEYRQRYAQQGKRLPTIDLLIAATAILRSCSLVTRNIKHYPMPELDLYREIY